MAFFSQFFSDLVGSKFFSHGVGIDLPADLEVFHNWDRSNFCDITKFVTKSETIT